MRRSKRGRGGGELSKLVRRACGVAMRVPDRQRPVLLKQGGHVLTASRNGGEKPALRRALKATVRIWALTPR